MNASRGATTETFLVGVSSITVSLSLSRSQCVCVCS